MARKSYTRKSSRGGKIQPSALTMTFQMPSTASGTFSTNYIDLSQVASLVNRRFYRQGINWAVAGFKFIAPRREPDTGTVTSQILVSKLPNSWVMSNSWEKGFRAWQRMNNQAISEAGSIRPKFLDFKIYADSDHHQLGVGANLLPYSINGLLNSVSATPGEWDYSTYEIPLSNVDASTPTGNSVTRDVVAVGANYPGPGASGNFAVSLIEGYAASRALPNIEAPNMPDDASLAAGSVAENWQVALFNDGNAQDSEVIVDLESQNNRAPYPFENDSIHLDTMYPGGANQLVGLQVHDVDTISNTTIGGMSRIKGGNFPCGLIRIDHDVPSWAVAHGLSLQIDLVPGNHRGYLCEPMTDM